MNIKKGFKRIYLSIIIIIFIIGFDIAYLPYKAAVQKYDKNKNLLAEEKLNVDYKIKNKKEAISRLWRERYFDSIDKTFGLNEREWKKNKTKHLKYRYEELKLLEKKVSENQWDNLDSYKESEKILKGCKKVLYKMIITIIVIILLPYPFFNYLKDGFKDD